MQCATYIYVYIRRLRAHARMYRHAQFVFTPRALRSAQRNAHYACCDTAYAEVHEERGFKGDVAATGSPGPSPTRLCGPDGPNAALRFTWVLWRCGFRRGRLCFPCVGLRQLQARWAVSVPALPPNWTAHHNATLPLGENLGAW